MAYADDHRAAIVDPFCLSDAVKRMHETLKPFPPDGAVPETFSSTPSSQIVPARNDVPVGGDHTGTAAAAGQGPQTYAPEWASYRKPSTRLGFKLRDPNDMTHPSAETP